MKKAGKILGISIGVLSGIVLIAVLMVVYVLFTPQRLTPIVRDVARQYISCPHEIGNVELTFFSTFPDFGLQIDGLTVINPMAGAPTDTVLASSKVVAAIDIVGFLRNQALDVRKVALDNVQANVYIDAAGACNADVLLLPADTTAKTDTAFSLPFQTLKIDGLQADLKQLTYCSVPDSMEATVHDVRLDASARSWEDIDLSLTVGSTTVQMGGERYADNLPLSVRLHHAAIMPESMQVRLPEATLGVDTFALQLRGEASAADDINLALQVQAQAWDIPQLLALLPPSITSQLEGIDIRSGKVSLLANVNGCYNDSTMPQVTAHIDLTDAAGAYKAVLPYDIKDINLTADAVIDLNDSLASSLTLTKLEARMQQSAFSLNGRIDELLANALCDVQLGYRLHLPELMPLLPADMQKQLSATGNLQGKLSAKVRLNDLTAMNLQRATVAGNIHCPQLSIAYDSIAVDASDVALKFSIPNHRSEQQHTRWLTATLSTKDFRCNMPAMQAALARPVIGIETSYLLSEQAILYAGASIQSEAIQMLSDSINATLQAPELTLNGSYNQKLPNTIPTIKGNLKLTDLQGQYAEMQAHLTNPDIAFAIAGSKRDATQPQVTLQLNTSSVEAAMAEDMSIKTKQLHIAAKARRNPAQDNLMLQWNPRLEIQLSDGMVNMASFKETIQIPSIDFDYSNKVCHINDSRITIGKSDFALTGQIDSIGKWLRKKAILTGELNFVSNHTDVNELMLLTSSDTGSEETKEPTTTESRTDTAGESHPYLVPTSVDLTINTHIKEAVVFDQTATDLGGRLYVKDGTLVLEEMGFICNAAKLQLTAMYRTPRRNHLYLGLDYHMLDINIEELIDMIPQIDSMVPMLSSFRGEAEFHLALESYLNSKYELKTSTTRGACSISGNDLVLLDNETFGKIAKILLFSKKTENVVDSISAEITLFKNEIDIYPFCLSIDNYMAAVGGRHNLDMSFDYHISLLKPLYIGVDVKGTFDDLHIRPTKCRYAPDFRPVFRREVDTQNAELRQKIKASLQKNVKQQ